jgi:hypothetical protein
MPFDTTLPRLLDGLTVPELIARDGPFTDEQIATLNALASSPRKEREPIHPAFRWVRSCGYRADPAEETRLENGDVRVEQWIWTPDIGWDRHVITVNAEAFVRWELASCPEVTGLFGPDSFSIGGAR